MPQPRLKEIATGLASDRLQPGRASSERNADFRLVSRPDFSQRKMRARYTYSTTSTNAEMRANVINGCRDCRATFAVASGDANRVETAVTPKDGRLFLGTTALSLCVSRRVWHRLCEFAALLVSGNPETSLP